jgi:hypothetical protein
MRARPGLLLAAVVVSQLVAVPAASATPSEACARYSRLTLAQRNGVQIEQWVIDLAKQLCDKRSTTADRVPVETTYPGDPCADYRAAQPADRTDLLATRCVATWVRFANNESAARTPAPDRPENKPLPLWARLLPWVVGGAGVLGLLWLGWRSLTADDQPGGGWNPGR